MKRGIVTTVTTHSTARKKPLERFARSPFFISPIYSSSFATMKSGTNVNGREKAARAVV